MDDLRRKVTDSVFTNIVRCARTTYRSCVFIFVFIVLFYLTILVCIFPDNDDKVSLEYRIYIIKDAAAAPR